MHYHFRSIAYPPKETDSHRPQQEGTYLAFQQEGVSTIPEGIRFLFAQQKDYPMGTSKTQPMRSRHHPELLLPSDGFSFHATHPNFLFFLYKVTFFFFVCWTIIDFAIACLS